MLIAFAGFGKPILLACARRVCQICHPGNFRMPQQPNPETLRSPDQLCAITFTIALSNNAIGRVRYGPHKSHAERLRGHILRPASRDLSGDARSGNTQSDTTVRGRAPKNTPTNDHALTTRLLLPPDLFHFRSARPSMASSGLARTSRNDLSTAQNTWKLPDISSLHNEAEQASISS